MSVPVSVVVVSFDRPQSLHLCLVGLSQLYYENYEIIVVANASSREGLAAFAHRDQVKLVEFDEPNISAARNRGIEMSGGEIIAFIDDDAVPEPTWLDHLVGAFDDQNVSAAGGYVIGRNGISLQWGARMAFSDGMSVDLQLKGKAPRVFEGEPGRAIRTEGTNMAFRRETLIELGGFDEAFRFYLDETDLNMRIARSGLKTAIVPLALVHHGYRESAIRSKNRVPKDLFHIGRSAAIYARKHGADVMACEMSLRDEQRRRLLRFMVAGDLLPTDVRELDASLVAGWSDGMKASFEQILDQESVRSKKIDFRPFSAVYADSKHAVFVGRFWQKSLKLQAAKELLKQGQRVTLFLFSFTALYHHVRFVQPGLWIHSGGQFGRSERNDAIFRLFSPGSRSKKEFDRIAGVRTRG